MTQELVSQEKLKELKTAYKEVYVDVKNININIMFDENKKIKLKNIIQKNGIYFQNIIDENNITYEKLGKDYNVNKILLKAKLGDEKSFIFKHFLFSKKLHHCFKDGIRKSENLNKIVEDIFKSAINELKELSRLSIFQNEIIKKNKIQKEIKKYIKSFDANRFKYQKLHILMDEKLYQAILNEYINIQLVIAKINEENLLKKSFKYITFPYFIQNTNYMFRGYNADKENDLEYLRKELNTLMKYFTKTKFKKIKNEELPEWKQLKKMSKLEHNQLDLKVTKVKINKMKNYIKILKNEKEK